MPIIDADGHLFETRSLWRDYADPRDRELAVSIEDDALGHPFLMFRGSPTYQCFVTVPGQISAVSEPRTRRRGGQRAEYSYDDMPADYWNPTARRHRLDDWGVDEIFALPQWGLVLERPLKDDLAGLRVNLAAWNRWAAEVVRDGQGRIHPVGHVSLQGDPEWVEQQLSGLAEAGVRLVYFSPGLINGKRMSHSDHDRIWSAFTGNDLSIIWHVATASPACIDTAWTDNDAEYMKAVEMPFLFHGAQIALADMSMNGVFQRHPVLRLGLIELNAEWLPGMLHRYDRAFQVTSNIFGQPINTSLEMLPSEYIRKHVRLTAFPGEQPLTLNERLGGIIGFGGDYPHFEGFADPYRSFQEELGPMDPAAARAFYGETMGWLVHH